MLEILGVLLTRLKSTRRLAQILLLQVIDVNKLVIFREHAVDAHKTDAGGPGHRLGLELLQIAQLEAKIVELHEQQCVSFFHLLVKYLFFN